MRHIETTEEYIQSLSIKDLLLEARRYAVRTPTAAVAMAKRAFEQIELMEIPEALRPLRLRILGNIDAGLKWRIVDPEILQGYLWGAAFEYEHILAAGVGRKA